MTAVFSRETAWAGRLLEEFKEICWNHHVDMALPLIRISDSQTRFGQWAPASRTLSISRHLIETSPWHVVVEVLKHEMAHQYVSQVMNEDGGHGPRFKEACQILGVHPDFIRSSGKIPRDMLEPEKGVSFQADKMIQTVQKLLSLAQSDNENEARAASRKANELIHKHNLDLFMDEARFEQSRAGYRVITHKKKQVTRLQKGILLILSQFYYVHPVLSKQYDARDQQSYQAMVLFGLPENLKIAEYVYHYLLETGTRLWQENRSLQGYTRKDEVSFYVGFTEGIKKTLTPSCEAPVRVDSGETRAIMEVSQSLSLSMALKIQTEMNRVFPRISRRRASYRHSSAAYNQGFKEGKKTHIRKGIHNKGKNTGLRLGPGTK